MKQVDESSNEKEIELSIGETLEVRLQENRTTGYRWVFESQGGPACPYFIDTFEPGAGVGAPGTHRWEFRAEQAGKADIALSYRRPWEESEVSRRFTVHVRVSG